MSTVASAAAVGHVVLQGVAKNMLCRSFHRHTASRTSDDNIQLTFPIDTLAAIGNSNRFAVGDHRRNRLGEQIWVLPRVVRLALPDTGDRFGRILRSRVGTGTGLHFSVVLTIVHRRIQNGHGIHHGRQNLDRLQIVCVTGPLSRSVGSRSNSIEASPNFFISRNKLLHIPWCSHFCGAGRTLKRCTSAANIHHDIIPQHQTEESFIAALKRTQLERLRRLGRSLREKQAYDYRERDRRPGFHFWSSFPFWFWLAPQYSNPNEMSRKTS